MPQHRVQIDALLGSPGAENLYLGQHRVIDLVSIALDSCAGIRAGEHLCSYSCAHPPSPWARVLAPPSPLCVGFLLSVSVSMKV